MVFRILSVIFRDLFYFYFTKGISLQRTSKRSVPNLNVRNPVLRGYRQISCPVVKSLLLKCFLCLVCYTALATLASEGPYLSCPRRDRVGHGRRWSAEGDGLVVRGDSWTVGAHLSPSLRRGAWPCCRKSWHSSGWETTTYRTTLKDSVFNPAVKILILWTWFPWAVVKAEKTQVFFRTDRSSIWIIFLPRKCSAVRLTWTSLQSIPTIPTTSTRTDTSTSWPVSKHWPEHNESTQKSTLLLQCVCVCDWWPQVTLLHRM